MVSNGKSEVILMPEDKKTKDVKFDTIHALAKRYDFKGLRALLNDGADINEKVFEGRNLLHTVLFDGMLGHLFEKEMISCVQVLIEFGANVNEEDQKKNTSLSLAVQNRFPECTKLLLQNGAYCSTKVAESLATSVPEVLLEIFDDGISVGTDPDAPERVMVKLDWRPIVQFPVESSEENKHFKYVTKETEFLHSLLGAKSQTRSRLLKHPLVEAFVHLKGRKMANRFRFFYLISVVYPIFYMIFIYFLYFERCAYEVPSSTSEPNTTSSTTNAPPMKPRTRCDITIPISVASYLLTLVIVAWGVGELYMQFRVDRQYLKSWRAWVHRVTIIVMGVTLWPGLQFNDVYNITFQYPIASMGTFLSWVMFMIQVGSYQSFSIYLDMLVKILLSVVKITLMFMPLFVGFFMGFNLMFSNMEGVFSYIMMTVDVGAVAYDTLIKSSKDNRLWFEMLAYTFCVGFIVIIVIVFMNYLLALSISDVDAMKGQAQMASTTRQIQNLFFIDLVDSSSGLISEQDKKKGEMCYTYCPSDNNLLLPKEIQMDITLLLKSKNLKRLRAQRNKSEIEMVQTVLENDASRMTKVLMRRIESLETKLDALFTKVVDEEL